MSTTTLVLAVPTVVTAGVVVGLGATVAARTEKLPLMPAAACPETVLRYAYVPLLEKATCNVVDCPGASSRVVFPAILKLWGLLPLFVTVKITVPIGTLLLESVNFDSVAATVTRIVACELAPLAGTKRPAARPIAAGAMNSPTLSRRPTCTEALRAAAGA